MRYNTLRSFPMLIFAFLFVTMAASASPLAGYWLTEDGTIVVGIDHCDHTRKEFCGLMVSFPGSATDSDLAAAQEALCQQPILWGLSKTGADSWGNGRIFDPITGKIYEMRLELNGDRLSVHISVGFLGLSETLVWSRITDQVRECEVADDAQ